jgi:hypothetical protein
MKVNRTESLTQAYILDSSELEKLCSRLQNWLVKFSFETTHRDSLKREFASLEELIQFENPPNKDIKTLRISGYSKDLNTRLWLKFDKDQFRNIYISIEGDEEPAIAINEIVEERIAAIRPWYAVLAQPAIFFIVATLFLLVWLLFIAWSLLTGRLSREGFTQSFTNTSVWGWIIPFLLGTVTTQVIEKARQFVFPMGVFAIGQGAKRHKDKELLRTGVVVAFAISLASSIIATLIFAL